MTAGNQQPTASHSEEQQTLQIRLTGDQQQKVREITGQDVECLSFKIEELEERIMPRLATN